MPVFNIFGSLVQFERDLIRELRAAREQGSKGGRRPVVNRQATQGTGANRSGTKHP